MENFNTMTNEAEEIVSVGQLQEILNSNVSEVTNLCQKACLRPKKDGFGNLYFSKSDIDVLKKVKELYEHTRQIQAKRQNEAQSTLDRTLKAALEETRHEIPNLQGTQEEVQNNFLARAKSRLKEIAPHVARQEVTNQINKSALMDLENSIVSKIEAILSEKMDGLDDVIVELIRSKTECESLRAKLNELNKENFNLKNENTSYKSIGLGLYMKKNTDEFML